VASFCRLAIKKIECNLHTKDFVRKKSTKVGGFQGISEIAIFRQLVPSGCQNTAEFMKIFHFPLEPSLNCSQVWLNPLAG
jgi:hypothetical protein